MSAAAFRRALDTYFNGSLLSVDDVAARYAERSAADGFWRTLARIMSDSGHACSARLHARALAATTSADVWTYEFSKPSDGLPGAVF